MLGRSKTVKDDIVFIKLTSTDGRRMVVRADQIDFMAEHPEVEPYRIGNHTTVAAQEAYTDIVLRSGERGKCKETMDQITDMIKRGFDQ